MADDIFGTTWRSPLRRTLLKGMAAVPAAAMLPRMARAEGLRLPRLSIQPDWR